MNQCKDHKSTPRLTAIVSADGEHMWFAIYFYCNSCDKEYMNVTEAYEV